MISFTSGIWFAAGLLAGSIHATTLWRNVHKLTVWAPLVGLLRLAFVTLLLIAAAINGQLLPSAAGWVCGFAANVCWLLTRRQIHPTDRCQESHVNERIAG